MRILRRSSSLECLFFLFLQWTILSNDSSKHIFTSMVKGFTTIATSIMLKGFLVVSTLPRPPSYLVKHTRSKKLWGSIIWLLNMQQFCYQISLLMSHWISFLVDSTRDRAIVLESSVLTTRNFGMDNVITADHDYGVMILAAAWLLVCCGHY